jgi:hypothetical protein
VTSYVRNFPQPPQTFLATMEEYVKEAPRMVPVREPLELPERLLLTYKPEESEEIPEPAPVEEEKAPVEEPDPVPPVTEVVSPPPKTEMPDTGDLLGLNDPSPAVSAIEESNALALAIVPTEGTSTTGSTAFQDKGFDPTGWELALVTAPSNTTSSASSSQLVGFFDLHIFFFLRCLCFSCMLWRCVTPEYRVATAIWAHYSHLQLYLV